MVIEMNYRLKFLYNLGACCSAACLVAICSLITIQVIGRIVDKTSAWLGFDNIGLVVPGLSEISGFLLVGATFLGLAYTFINHGHIRVTLLISHLKPKKRLFIEIWCLSLALALCLYLTFYTFRLVEDSWSFNEMSYGLLRIKLWIPQSVMLLGMVLFSLALFETWANRLIQAFTQPDDFLIDDSGHE